ncbi:hypothetical protein TWF481_002563 [Arthrobotrys musiformis]|uniref:NACHT domain-containing protein n=1 Tax=Arthrobotrys musiformis TaxID=47236 RepID=A0AAV9VSL4_9PEZI
MANTFNNTAGTIGYQGSVNNYGSMVFDVVNNQDRRAREIEFLTRIGKIPYRDRKDRNPERIPGTCEWFVAHGLFQEWQESKSSRMLWVSADPGCGKSVLAKYLVDSVLDTESRTTCYFFFKDDFEDQRNVVSALCSILHQLFRRKPALLSDTILKEFEDGPVIFTSSFNSLWDTLLSAAKDKRAGEIICLLDAIDECEDNGRSQLAKALCKLYGTRSDFNLKFLLTSRPYSEIRQGFHILEIPGLPVIHLSGESEVEMEKISREIDVFIRVSVRNIGTRSELTPDEQQLLLRELTRVPNRTYLWVHLTLDSIKSDININQTKLTEVASNLPKTVDEAYNKILSKSHNFEEAKKLLQIVIAAARPLTLKEMSLALDLRGNHQSYEDLALRPEERFRRNVRDLCGLFVTIVDSSIYLFHQTAKEFLVQNDLANPTNNDLIWKYSIQPRDSHRVLAKICIQHLFFAEFETNFLDKDAILSEYVESHVFLGYSAKYWMTHLHKSEIEPDETESIMKLCDSNSKRCLTWLRVYWTSTNTDFPENFTKLMIASYFGLATVVKLILKSDGIDPNSKDDTYGRSALSWAAGNGFDVVVEHLIKASGWKDMWLSFRGRDQVNSVDRYGRAPLVYAVWNRHVATIELLLKAGARVDSADEIGGTPLSYAICSGNDEVAKLLFKDGTTVDLRDDRSRGLLLSAAEKGHEAVVKLLLEAGKVGPDIRDALERTPLSQAVEGGRVAIAQFLLDQKVKTDYQYYIVSESIGCLCELVLDWWLILPFLNMADSK